MSKKKAENRHGHFIRTHKSELEPTKKTRFGLGTGNAILPYWILLYRIHRFWIRPEPNMRPEISKISSIYGRLSIFLVL